METDTSEPTTSTEQTKPTREDYLRGVEEIIALLRANLDLPLPTEWNGGGRVTIWTDSKAEVAAIVRAMGGGQKDYGSSYFSVERKYGPVNFQVLTGRSTVCRRVVKGTRVIPAVPEQVVDDVEWVCEGAVYAWDKPLA